VQLRSRPSAREFILSLDRSRDRCLSSPGALGRTATANRSPEPILIGRRRELPGSTTRCLNPGYTRYQTGTKYPAGQCEEKSAPLDFPRHVAALRKERGFTQRALANMVGMHISQIRRYEGGQSQPTLDAIRKLSLPLSVSADMLLFEEDERGPDEELKLQFEAVSRLDAEEKKIIRSVIESLLLRYEARRWSAPGK